MQRKVLFGKLVFASYVYFIFLGFLWMIASLYFGGGFSYYALAIILASATQLYFKKKLTNLILGILGLAVSIFWSLEFALLGQKAGFTAFVDIMLSICLISLAMSIVLIFSYTQLSFHHEE